MAVQHPRDRLGVPTNPTIGPLPRDDFILIGVSFARLTHDPLEHVHLLHGAEEHAPIRSILFLGGLGSI